MALLVPNVGEDKFLANIVNKTAPDDLTLKLYKNDKTPAEGDIASDYTVANFTGYSTVNLTAASWSVSNPTASYPQLTFASTAGGQNQPVYGYYVIGTVDGVLRWAERFTDGPYTIVNDGDQIKVTPKITLD